MTPQKNIKAKDEALRSLKSHCLAADFKETRSHVTVIFPPGYFPEGVRVHKSHGARAAYLKAVEVMERTWKDSQL